METLVVVRAEYAEELTEILQLSELLGQTDAPSKRDILDHYYENIGEKSVIDIIAKIKANAEKYFIRLGGVSNDIFVTETLDLISMSPFEKVYIDLRHIHANEADLARFAKFILNTKGDSIEEWVNSLISIDPLDKPLWTELVAEDGAYSFFDSNIRMLFDKQD